MLDEELGSVSVFSSLNVNQGAVGLVPAPGLPVGIAVG
jgi:hypothetical protein